MSEQGEIYLKFTIMSFCVFSCKVMSARILELSCDFAYWNNLDDLSVRDTFLCYLFSYDDTHACVGSIFYFSSGINRSNKSLLESILGNSFLFDPVLV